MAQSVERFTRNEQVVGSIPTISSNKKIPHMLCEEFFYAPMRSINLFRIAKRVRRNGDFCNAKIDRGVGSEQ